MQRTEGRGIGDPTSYAARHHGWWQASRACLGMFFALIVTRLILATDGSTHMISCPRSATQPTGASHVELGCKPT